MMNPGANTLKLTTRGDREIEGRRSFDAPRQLVFDAWTKPELIKRWLGVRPGWTFPVCEVDLKVGGKYRYVWKGPQGEMAMGGTFREIQRPERLVSSEKFDQSWYPGEAINTLLLDEQDGKTQLTMITAYESKEARDVVLASPMEEGLREGFDLLATILAEILAG